MEKLFNRICELQDELDLIGAENESMNEKLIQLFETESQAKASGHHQTLDSVQTRRTIAEQERAEQGDRNGARALEICNELVTIIGQAKDPDNIPMGYEFKFDLMAMTGEDLRLTINQCEELKELAYYESKASKEMPKPQTKLGKFWDGFKKGMAVGMVGVVALGGVAVDIGDGADDLDMDGLDGADGVDAVANSKKKGGVVFNYGEEGVKKPSELEPHERDPHRMERFAFLKGIFPGYKITGASHDAIDNIYSMSDADFVSVTGYLTVEMLKEFGFQIARTGEKALA